jgi:hypothetical protein
MTTFNNNEILAQLDELDPFSRRELLDFLGFLRCRKMPSDGRVNRLNVANPFPVTRVEDGIGCVGYVGPR